VVEPPPKQEVPSDKPQYGGTFTIVGADIQIFGAAVSNRGPGQSGYVIQQLTTVDRTTGPGGSKQVDYSGMATSFKDVVGFLAESWSTPDVGVWVLNIRRGVRFALDPANAGSALVNGREMTAEDVAYSLEYIRDTPSSWIQLAEPALIKNMTIERSGPWQITIKTPVNPANGYLWLTGGGGNGYIWPKEFLQKYGTNNDWRLQVGTGPYMLKDWVQASSASYIRNPNYWEKDPVGPGKGNQLPYMDKVTYLVIPDVSTQLAAFRTGRVDRLINVLLEDGNAMLKSNPKTNYYKVITAPYQVAMRTDKKELPYKDIRVRKALMMATDMVAMQQSLYSGQAEILDSPARKLYAGVYTPLEQLPAETQELYKYNPEKARQLLKDAGYPNGFKATIVLPISPSLPSDLAAILKDMWSKVGVDLSIQPKDIPTYNAVFAGRNYEDMFFGTQPGGTGQLYTRYGNSYFRTANNFNLSYISDPTVGTIDPTIEQYFTEVTKNVMVNFDKCEELMKALNQYTLSQAFLIPTPAPYAFILWQPWIKNYYGESATAHWLQYMWIDQDLKKAMGK